MSTHYNSKTRAMVASLMMAIACAAHGQEAPLTAVYDSGFYSQFRPDSALDMIQQTPGFILDEGAERRGFAGAAGNVLIDGARPVAKSQTLTDILQRIPAAQVVRIEILRGTETAGDESGQNMLANVVLAASTGQGVWALGGEYANRHRPAPNGRVFWSDRAGATEYNLGAMGYSFSRNLPGDRTIRDDAGELTATLEDDSPRTYYEFALNGAARRPAFGGQLRITGHIRQSRYEDDSAVIMFAPAGERIEDQLNPYWERKRSPELGMNYEHGVGAWKLELAALLSREHYASTVDSTSRDPALEINSIFTQDIDKRSGESILKAAVSRDMSSKHRIQYGLEGAVNTLNQDLVLTLDLGDGPFPIPVPNSNLTVEETRTDAFVAHTWQFSELWSSEARLAGEASRLSFTGDAEQTTEFEFLKP
jgi:hypothetical protein